MYHALDNFSNIRGKKYEYYKWLDLHSLMQNFLEKNDKLVTIYYFSAYADWKPEQMKRHKLYVQALENVGVRFIEGRFKQKQQKCKAQCKQKFTKHEEKETDVNIALYLLRDAYEDIYDKAILVSQDSDLCPVVEMVKKKFPNKKLKIITPLNARHSSKMINLVGKKHRGMINQIHIERALFDAAIVLPNGKTIIRPQKYTP